MGWYSYKDYSSKIWDNDLEIDQEYRESDLLEYAELITDPENSTLIGLSEGAQMALDLSKYIPKIKGIVALSPAYTTGLGTNKFTCPVVLIASQTDDRVMRCYSDKWKKRISNFTEVN